MTAAAPPPVMAIRIGAARQERLNSLLGRSGPVLADFSLDVVGQGTVGYVAQTDSVPIDIGGTSHASLIDRRRRLPPCALGFSFEGVLGSVLLGLVALGASLRLGP